LSQLKLERRREVANLARMKFILAVVVYAAIALLLGAGIIMAVKGSFWLLAAGLIVYLITFSKFGCLNH